MQLVLAISSRENCVITARSLLSYLICSDLVLNEIVVIGSTRSHSIRFGIKPGQLLLFSFKFAKFDSFAQPESQE